ncbi:MAG: FlgD immunoglobulin-like domain containing protein [Sulfuricurvum sp.]|uniref:FlgD immunoglobulin-like domain containing protein n=1 Tax=Sulfuricurvum sp. TaxID=2025608 RepID=UPI00262B83B4|nr:FlgD immunoglobulin-like domain containing protein [Sulfuricurvum sp.]MDD2367886.1 FlgD immunoglobulin-like domain containing protein [Sulfuricurvum sp.]MDD2950015.1 FlgD immunoglobulin-like domain containing protein [Sulfuricurvum sp.]MDD5119470.1 FlgD immunoglobulin-like domain containing protein [Sulfuricurvum sp.]
MAIDAYGNTLTSSSSSATTSSSTVNPNGVLGKDDFLKLLMLELKYQDPTSPMDSEKILTQTSQLATLESSENTTKALTTLASALTASAQFTGISAIGKIADTGSNAILATKGEKSVFELYFPDAVTTGKINIMDANGKILKTMDVGATDAGVAQYTWDGTNSAGSALDSGTYYVESTYTKADGTTATTRIGRYPIDSIKFDSGKTYAKLGSSYVDFSTIKEITNN